MRIAIATKEDIITLSKLAVEFRDSMQREIPTADVFTQGISRLFESNDAEFLISKDENENASGYVLMRYYYSMWLPGFEARIEDLFVNPKNRQNGIGKKLIEFSLERAREKGCLSIYLDTNENNEASNKIYTQLGFNSRSKRWNDGRQIFYRLALKN